MHYNVPTKDIKAKKKQLSNIKKKKILISSVYIYIYTACQICMKGRHYNRRYIWRHIIAVHAILIYVYLKKKKNLTC